MSDLETCTYKCEAFPDCGCGPDTDSTAQAAPVYQDLRAMANAVWAQAEHEKAPEAFATGAAGSTERPSVLPDVPILAQAVPLLTVEEIQAAWVEHGLDDCAVEDFAKAIEQAVRAKLEVAAPLLTDDEIDAVWDAIPQNQFWWRRYARAIEQAVRAKMGVAQEDTDRLQWLADNMMMQSGYKNTGTWALPDLPWVASGRESCLIEDLRCVIDTHIEQSRLSKEGA